MSEQIIEIDEAGNVIAHSPKRPSLIDQAAHIRRGVLAAHQAVLRMSRARSRSALRKNTLIAFGELETILEVLPSEGG